MDLPFGIAAIIVILVVLVVLVVYVGFSALTTLYFHRFGCPSCDRDCPGAGGCFLCETLYGKHNEPRQLTKDEIAAHHHEVNVAHADYITLHHAEAERYDKEARDYILSSPYETDGEQSLANRLIERCRTLREMYVAFAAQKYHSLTEADREAVSTILEKRSAKKETADV